MNRFNRVVVHNRSAMWTDFKMFVEFFKAGKAPTHSTSPLGFKIGLPISRSVDVRLPCKVFSAERNEEVLAIAELEFVLTGDLLRLGNDVTVSPSGVSAESLLIKKIAVSGK